ncbi:LuxR C-terminal-related transcriptional regulator [Raineyella sp. LH-20]|uniref:LuxR C-terminal-related transcriptional regulator n=1 Tax=Raineyella sp. LH-20 TaxID=3081204 RepID=UPI00295367D5|nr:LuxR C-terminal-related transcriptional regulator [Raineyella sp. LH-20]WOP20083.1 LuxR C-terminal-related transcriptional regulator [Raineyella sp. LH-20]
MSTGADVDVDVDVDLDVHVARFRGLSEPARALVEELAAGFGLDDCPTAGRSSAEQYDDLLAEVESAGLLTGAGDLPPAVARSVIEELPLHRRRRLQRKVLEALPEDPTADPPRLARVAATGVQDPKLVTALIAFGDDQVTDDPEAALEWYDLAEGAGATAEILLARRAEAAVRTGDLAGAAGLVDAALALPEPPEPRRTAGVALAVLGQSGIGPLAGEVVGLLGPRPSGSDTACGAAVLIGRGHRDGAEQLVVANSQSASRPTVREAALALVVNGLAASIGDSPADALPFLVRAAQTMPAGGDDALLPAHPAMLAALAALHTGELGVAESVLDGAVDAVDEDSRWSRPLIQLSAWARMVLGDVAGATDLRRRAAAGSWPMTSRDAFWDLALGVGLARRGDDTRGLAEEWRRAGARLIGHPVDLYDLLPLGELHVAAVRVHDPAKVAPHLRMAWALLERLDSPPLWATALHWDVIQGAILANQPRDIAPHAQALVRSSARLPYAAILAEAGRVWMQVMAQRFVVGEVVQAVHRLRDAGQVWDACRLAGHAAARADDRKDTARLLECARELMPGTADDPEPSARVVELSTGRVHLSGRERQVARLVVAGNTYREVGARLFLSERTVEHHIARIRQRLGVNSRAELLDHLRIALDQLAEEDR